MQFMYKTLLTIFFFVKFLPVSQKSHKFQHQVRASAAFRFCCEQSVYYQLLRFLGVLHHLLPGRCFYAEIVTVWHPM